MPSLPGSSSSSASQRWSGSRGWSAIGRVTARSFTLSARITIDGEPAELEIRGQLKDGVLEGKLSGALGDDVAWKGKKDP